MQKQPRSGAWPGWFVPLVIFLLTVVAFFPVLHNGFVNWDDDASFLENPNYRGLGWRQLRWMFSTFYTGHYQPLSWVTFGLDYLFWGMEPFGYHLTNLLLHAANAVLFYFVALRLLSLAVAAVPGEIFMRVAAGFAGLVFAVHPLRVESVAWATERRDVLSGLFFLLTILCYLRANAVQAVAGSRLRWMTVVVIVYGLSLLSKASGITLPIVFLVLDIYPLRRLGNGSGRFDLEVSTVRLDRTAHLERWLEPETRRVWWEKVPFLLLAALFGMIALLAQQEAGALKPLERYGVASRLGQALFGIAFYLWKTAIPLGLSPLYEIPTHLDPWDWSFILSGLVILVLSLGLFMVRQRWPAGLAIWACYVVLLAPVLGIAQSGPQLVADRYTYLSCLGWAILSGAGLFYGWQVRFSGATSLRAFVLAAGLASVVVLGVLTWKQAQVWHDSERLWRYVLTVTEKSYFKSSVAHSNLGAALVSRGELEEAIQHYREALRINPAYAEAHNNLGNALLERGELGEAIEHFRQALRIYPAYAEAHYNVGNALVKQGDLEEAISHYREALRINPGDVKAHYNLGTVLARKGELEEAIEHFRQTLQIDPAYAKAHYNLGTALAIRGELEEAIDHFREALKINPDHAEAHHNLGRVEAAQGHLDRAIDHFRQALRIEPEYAEAHESLARALAQRGKREEAVQHYQEALRIMKSRSEGHGQR